MDFQQSKAKNYSMSIPGKKLLVNGVNYHVSDQGLSDKVALLLHGMPDTSSMWRHTAKTLLAEGYRVVAPDMLGYGETDKPLAIERYEAEHISADMLAIIEHLGLPKMDIVGHDWGAFVAWDLVLNKPELFRRHVALSVGHPGLMFDNITMQSAKENWYMYMNTQTHAPELYALNNFKFLRETWIPSYPELDELCERLKDPAAMNGMLNWDRANQVVSIYLANAAGELTFGQCSVPTMGIWSSGDLYLAENWMTETDRFMDAEWRYERIEDASHWMMLDQPEATNALILQWLNTE